MVYKAMVVLCNICMMQLFSKNRGYKMLKNKVAIITGGSKGIGFAITEALVKEGAKAVIADIDEKNGTEAAERLGCDFVKCDISKETEVKKLLEETTKKHSVVNVVVNTAKVYFYNSMKDIETKQWTGAVNVNLNGLFNLAKNSLSLLQEVKGVFVEVASGLGGPLERRSCSYSTTEAAGFALVKNIARTYGGEVRAVGVNPGPIDTPLLHTAFEGDFGKYSQMNPSKRVGSPKEVADLVLYLCSEKARYINGAIYNIDGGEGSYQN